MKGWLTVGLLATPVVGWTACGVVTGNYVFVGVLWTFLCFIAAVVAFIAWTHE